MPNDSSSTNNDLSNIENTIDNIRTNDDPNYVLEKAKENLHNLQNGQPIDGIFLKALSLAEHKNGVLITTIVPDQYKTFSIDMLRKVQDEYSCKTASLRATAEVAVLAFVRILELQRRLDNYLEQDNLKQIDINYFSVLSKELDRAHRQYIQVLQTLKFAHQPAMKVNIKTNTAIVGENQIIQENQNVKPI